MKPHILYRVAAVLLGLFAIAHQLGFRQVDPSWGAGAVAGAMKRIHFTVQGFSRTYWDFFSGFGFFSTVFLLFSAYLAWELSRMRPEARAALGGVRWMFAATYIAIAVLMFTNFFAAPAVFAVLIAASLTAGAARS